MALKAKQRTPLLVPKFRMLSPDKRLDKLLAENHNRPNGYRLRLAVGSRSATHRTASVEVFYFHHPCRCGAGESSPIGPGQASAALQAPRRPDHSMARSLSVLCRNSMCHRPSISLRFPESRCSRRTPNAQKRLKHHTPLSWAMKAASDENASSYPPVPNNSSKAIDDPAPTAHCVRVKARHCSKNRDRKSCKSRAIASSSRESARPCTSM